MANNTQNPKTKVNPLNAGLGIEGLKGYNPQKQTQEVKEESRVYTVTKNDGTQVDKSYAELSPAEKAALKKNAGVVSGGKTDIERQYSVAPSSVGTKPTRNITTGSGLATATSIVTPIALGAITKGIPGAIAGAAMSAINAISAGANASEIERRYQEAMREYNDKISKSAKVAGSWEKDEDGNLIFMPDYSKVGEDISVEASGAKIADLFNLNDNTEPNVYFGDDGVLHIDINRAFANTKEYNDIINSISSDYAGLTKDTADVDAYLSDFRQRLSSALDQYRFEVNRIAGYKSKLPNASTETIMDAARGEIGAMLSDADKKDWKVRVYRDGNLVESTAKDVLDHVYNMDKYERNDYIEGLADALEDDSISDNEKAYVLAEYNLLFSASDADVKEGDASKERKKYAEMLDQDFAVTVLRSSRLIRGFDTLADSVAGLISQGATDDILLANQDYLEPEEVAQNFGSVFGTAFDIYASQKIMQGLEQKIVRPVLGAGARAIGGRLINAGSDKIADIGRKMIEASGTSVINRAGDIIGYRTALDITGAKNAALANIIKAFSGEGSISYRLLAKGGAQVMTYMMGEIAINATSDALYDVAKLGTATLSGDIKSGDEAFEYLKSELGQDLVMDTIIQFGPQGLIDLHTTMDAIRLQNIEPYARGVAEARTKYGEAVSAVDEAKANGKSTKKLIRELESNVVSAKNDLTKAEAEYADARKEWIGSKGQQFGSKIAELESRLTENEMFRKFQESVMDENVAGTALAKSAYAASGGDVELFNRLLNTVSNNLRTVTRITANEMSSDKWAEGTGEAYNAFKRKYSELASRTGKMSETDIDYIKAQNELIRYTEAAKGDKKLIADANAFYSKYIDAVSPDRAAQLNELMDTMREAVNKTNESAIGAGIQTEENIQTKREATGFQEQGYIPMYLKKKNKTGHYIIPQERNLDRTWDRGEFWELDNLENPALNVLTYINYTARNIALNERNKAIIAATEIPGMRTYRTDVDNEIIRTEDGNAYKHSDIIEHMTEKIDARIGKIEKLKRETPTELEFADEKNRVLYGKADGTHEELVNELREIADGVASPKKTQETTFNMPWAKKDRLGTEGYKYVEDNAGIPGVKEEFGSVVDWVRKGGSDEAIAERYNTLPEEVRNFVEQDKNFQRLADRYGLPTAFIRVGVDFPISRLLIDKSYGDYLWAKNNSVPSGAIVEPADVGGDNLRTDVANRIDALKKYYDDTYGKFGYTTGVRVRWGNIDALIEQGDMDGLATYLEGLKDRASLAPPTDQTLSDTALDKQATGLEIEIKRSLDKNFPGLNNEQKRDVFARVLGEFRAKAAESGDTTATQVANEAFARNVGYPITYYDAGEEKTAYITGPLAKPVYEMCVRSENVADRNFVQIAFQGAAKLKRYATTAIDVARALPNLLRDTLRGDIMSGGTDYAGARKIFADILDAEGLTAEQKAKAMESVELAIRAAQGQTLNAAIENRTERGLQDMVRETRQEGKNAVSRIIWDVTHGRIGSALETPMNVAEAFTRRRMAQSAYIREFKDAKYTSTSFDERLVKAYDAGINAGIENTTNFSRRGTMVGTMARYVPYFQQNFSNIESAKISFMKDPAGVAARAAIFQYAFVTSLANTLKKEETRRAYYNLSDYDRKNNIVFSLDGETLVTIPLDESLASLITPWRRTVETLNNVDPGTFASIFTDTLLDMSPVDLDGFTEGDSLNVRRGIEKLTSQIAPSLATELLQTVTGYELYYGTDRKVTDESLAQRGLTAQSAGDYTTVSANSKLLRKVADATGIPQWMLQQTVANFGGNVGQYVLNTLDKLAGASKDEQGGKEFVNAVFKSMTGTDSTNVKTQFYNGMNLLRKERTKVVNKLQSLNDDIATTTGAEQADLRKQYQKVKDDYAMKVSNFVDQYLNAYEITGGLAASQAQQIYWLFNLYDDNTVYESGSVGEYYQNLAKQEANKDATSWAAPVLDKYYDQTQNVYKDASGTWKYSSPYGERAYYNTIWGQGMKHQVGLRNLIEGITSGLKSARSAASSARSAAIEAGDYDRYDQIGADFDAQVIKAIDPYIKEYGAENVLNNSSVLDYLEEWFFVPSSFMRTKKGKYVPSLANNASKQRAFVRPYIKSLYGVDTGYTEKNYENLLNPEVFPNE